MSFGATDVMSAGSDISGRINGIVTLLMVVQVKSQNLRNPMLCGKTTRHRMPGHALPRFEGLRAFGPFSCAFML
jgi:hypothetical protein